MNRTLANKNKKYKSALLLKLEELRSIDISLLSEETPPNDGADIAATNYAKESLRVRLNTNNSEQVLVQLALDRINDGSYGTCVDCEEPILEKRLNAVPWANRCIKCAKEQEGQSLVAAPLSLRESLA